MNQQFIKLTQQNQQHRANLQQRKQSLLMHQKIISELNCPYSQNNKQIIDQLLKKYDEIHQLYALWLVQSQIKNSQDVQFRDLLKQYENRIEQLLDILVQKEQELCAKMKTKRMAYKPYQGRIRDFNMVKNQQDNFSKLILEYKKLTKQVNLLKQQVNAKKHVSSQQSQNQTKKSGNNPENKKYVCKDRDIIHQKIFKMLEQQIQQQKALQKQAQLLQKQLQQLSITHRQAVAKYTKSNGFSKIKSKDY